MTPWTMPEPWVKARERFRDNTAEHEMEIIHDDGLHRHLRFQKPGTSIYYYDLVTWPGYLVVCGDAGDYMFSRTRDMFEFFEGSRGEINPGYWAEKLRGPGRDTAREYSYEAFKARVLEWYRDTAKDMSVVSVRANLRQAVREQLLQEDDWGGEPSEEEVHRRLRDFEFEGRGIYDPSDWDLREYDHRFLWCCWAIVDGIRRYRAIERMVAE